MLHQVWPLVAAVGGLEPSLDHETETVLQICSLLLFDSLACLEEPVSQEAATIPVSPMGHLLVARVTSQFCLIIKTGWWELNLWMSHSEVKG